MNHHEYRGLTVWVVLPTSARERLGHRSRLALALLLSVFLALGPGASRQPTSASTQRLVGQSVAEACHWLDRPVLTDYLSLRAAVASATPTQLETFMDQINAAWNARDWPLVLDLIDQVIAIDPNYDDIQSKRYYALINYGYELLTAGQCTDSLAAFREALLLQPEGEEALMGLDLVSRYCPTPVPGSTNTPGPSPTASLTPAPHATPTPVFLTDPITYTVQVGDTLYSLSKRYSTTVQAIMQANGMMSYFLRAGDVIWIPASGSPPPGPIVHIVQPGETLYSIARQYDTTVWAIMAANNLTSSLIWAYRALYIPTVQATGPTVHVVSQGETLSSIARRYETTVALLMLANHLEGYTIYPYQRLVIPPEGWSGWPELLPVAGSGRTYRVAPGDTLFSIGQRFGVTVPALMAANGLTSSFIRAGSYLRIP
ncbi:MAG: LysM peptidoglycan-binding domain-containing protein [Anaerolineae bacterium]|nr:LysM peptidoglycan-binding domain-containing protein [Anaerolineae bacterium]